MIMPCSHKKSGTQAWHTGSVYFHARNIPDRFKVYYGDIDEWKEDSHEFELIFNSLWVSQSPQSYIDPSRYQPDPKHHDWHENVEGVSWLQWWGPGGKYEAIIEKEADRDVLMIETEGRDNGTIWDYKLNLN